MATNFFPVITRGPSLIRNVTLVLHDIYGRLQRYSEGVCSVSDDTVAVKVILNTVQPAYKVVQIQGMSAYSVRSSGLDSCVCIGIGIGKSRLYGFSGYRGGPERFHINRLPCTYNCPYTKKS